MVATIVGWYGTETKGDVAILDGIINVLEAKGIHDVLLGSLFPFYTERTLYENELLFLETAPNVSLSVFSVKNAVEVEEAISKSDVLIFGGGPLMDLEELFLMESTFRVAKKRGIPSYVMGCGIGPLFKRRYICLVKNIFTMASKIALRDKESVQLAKELYGERLGQKIVYLGDPAIISIERFKKENDAVPNLGQIAINLREYPRSVYHHDSVLKDSDYEQLLKNLSSEYENVYLVPMLDFAAGYDDRRYLSRISLHTSCSNVHVLHHPLGLKGLYNLYMNSYGCIGMRHHSVVMQTILNGNNYIIDYTEPKRGKTQGFINSIDRDGFYDSRTLNIQCGEKSDLEKVGSILKTGKRFVWKESTIKEDYSLWLNM